MNRLALAICVPLFSVAALFANEETASSQMSSAYKQSPSTSSPVCEMDPSCRPPTYSLPAQVMLNQCWDLFVAGNFLYWQPQGENLNFGLALSNNTTSAPVTTTGFQPTHVILPDFSFGPGFKVALGACFNYDNWDASIEYTWFHTTSTTSASVSSGSSIYPLQADQAFYADFLLRSAVGSLTNTVTSGSNSWQLKLDAIDAVFGRSYYSGKKLTFYPYLGARGAWIRNKFTSSYSGTNYHFLGSIHSTNWGVGPRAGVNGNWMIGSGFRLYGNAAADILYTCYNERAKQNATTASTGSLFLASQYKVDDGYLLRPHSEMELGLGWGSYFDCCNYHVDLYAGYTFQVFWDQLPQESSNLYISGLNTSLKFNF